MRNLVLNDRERVGAWVAKRVGRVTPWKEDAALGLEKDGELIAGIVLDGYSEGVRASMHCAGTGKTWLNREFLFACFDYAFNHLNLKVLINYVSADNADSLRFTKHIGFTEIGRAPQGWDGVSDMVLFQLHRDDCRWLGGRHGR
jgi:RimJ/RimL family protein N-acetyltransferase